MQRHSYTGALEPSAQSLVGFFVKQHNADVQLIWAAVTRGVGRHPLKHPCHVFVLITFLRVSVLLGTPLGPLPDNSGTGPYSCGFKPVNVYPETQVTHAHILSNPQALHFPPLC